MLVTTRSRSSVNLSNSDVVLNYLVGLLRVPCESDLDHTQGSELPGRLNSRGRCNHYPIILRLLVKGQMERKEVSKHFNTAVLLELHHSNISYVAVAFTTRNLIPLDR